MTDIARTDVQPPQWIRAWLPHRDKIVSALTLSADAVSGSSQQQIHQLADEVAFLNEDADVLLNPFALEIFLNLEAVPVLDGPFTPSVSKESSPTPAETDPEQTGTVEPPLDLESRIQSAVNSTLLAHIRIQSRGQRILTVIAYPLVVMTVCMGVLIFAGLLIVPTFEQMFDEFGLKLPFFTQLLFRFSNIVQSPFTYVVLFGLTAIVALAAWLRWGTNSPLYARSPRRGTRVQFRPTAPRSTRGTCADWAWHLSLLMRTGLSKADAIEVAGVASAQKWLCRGSQFWADAIRMGDDPFHGVTHFRRVPCHMLADALSIDVALAPQRQPDPSKTPPTPGTQETLNQYQANILREIAELYWDRDRHVTIWRLGWVSPLIVFCVGFIIWFVVIALFAPLVSLISGLT
ncbi:type II secretion system F family protein [Rhodopirellula sallentina]|uniref:Type II secretion system F domain protein n=1 Tax=Rhodopirellula sallentina SM41 TaxID=1263870 RepID=M5UA68_9BACT|nr:type II secretion system F domain protein [Rhodopirellula sallentina]EMI54726.1 Type II secretion system F domain protein [Rhodopirellula sallentina SM41]